MKLTHLTLGVTLAASLALAACGPQDNSTNSTSAHADDSPVLATVNGEPIHASTLDALLSSLNGKNQKKIPPQAKRKLLDRLVQLKVMSQAANKNGLADTPEFKAELRIQRQALLARKLVKDHMAEHPVTEEQVKDAYDKKTKSMNKTEYKARHILVDDKATAEKAIKKLENGADFAKLAKKMSTGPSAKSGGELGWFSPSDMVPPFAAALKTLDKGNYTAKPVKTKFGWHVILLEDTRPVSHPSLKKMAPAIKQRLQRSEARKFIQSVRDNANVDIDESRFESGQATPGAPKGMQGAAAQPGEMPAPASRQQPQSNGAG